MKCPACEQINPGNAKFCSECGGKLAQRCAACSAELGAGANFCNVCGSPVADGSDIQKSAAEEARPTPSPLKYTPKHLADKILGSRSALEGERKQVTVLFADVKSSMELAGRLDPEEWHEILDQFFSILTEGVHRYEGTVNQYTGDGIMALFGAPIAHEDHAQRACYTALHLGDELALYSTELKRAHGLSFSTRIGVNSGEVVVGSIGDDLRMDYTAQGQSVGLAQRIESLAEPNTCYVSEKTASLVRGFFQLDDLGEFNVDGVSSPVRIHRLAGIGGVQTRFDQSRARGLSRFVGRAADLRTLEDALDQTVAGNGQVVGIVAEAGTGKSRLCFEFLESCRARGLGVFEGRAVAHGRNIPYLPILELFRSYFSITIEDDDRRAREKIAGRLVVLDRRYAETLPVLFDFLGVADPHDLTLRVDPDVRHRQLVDLMRQVTQNSSQPTVTVIEDLHWLDSASAALLEHMVDARAGTRSLLLLNFRPEYSADWMQKSWYRQLPLAPLGLDAMTELLTDLLGSDESISGIAEPIYARTSGNPFFTEEIAQSLIESGNLAGGPGRYRLVTPIGQLAVPATVQAVLAARIDRLSERDKRVLQTAAVIGKDFGEPLLTVVAGLPDDELKMALTALCHAEFLYEQTLYPTTIYAFKHPLTQEVALGSVLRDRRRQVHGVVARAIEQQDAERLDERAALLAHHWEEAGEGLAAAHWHRAAAVWVGRTDTPAATHHWVRVRELLHELPVDHEVAQLGVAACAHLLGLAFRVGAEPSYSRAVLLEGQDYANAVEDRHAYLTLSIAYAQALVSAGDIEKCLELALENQRAALELGDIAMQANASVSLCSAYVFSGRCAEGLAVSEEGLGRFPRELPDENWILGLNPFAFLSFCRAISLAWAGRLADAFEEFERCRRLAEEDNTPELVSYVELILTQVHYLAYDVEQVLSGAQRFEEMSHSLGEPPNMVALTPLLYSYAHLAAGWAADAIEPAQTALDHHLHRVEKVHAGWSGTVLAEAFLQAGELSSAESAARTAIAHCQRSQRLNYEAIAQGILARALLRRDGAGARKAAEAALANAAALIERASARILAPSLCEWRAELAATLENGTMVKQLLGEAHEYYREFGAPRQAERIARLLAESEP